MKCKIGTIEQKLEGDKVHRFIIDKEGDTLVYHARDFNPDNPNSEKVAEMVGANNVIEEGYAGCYLGGDELRFWGGLYSGEGLETLETLSEGLLAAYQEINPDFKKVGIRKL
jgi:hypothetical protein